MKPALYLAPLLLICVPFLIRAEIKGIKRQIIILKPLCTLMVITAACFSFIEPGWNPVYSILILVGLIFSLGGDIALIFKEKGNCFTLGLVLFLVAHIFYTSAFFILGRFSALDLLIGSLLLAAAVGFFLVIWANLGKMKTPVVFYVLIISLMVSRSFSTLAAPEIRANQAWMIIIGAAFFYVSDLILAANRYWKPWKYNRISLAFYFLGQYLLALAASYF